MSQDQDLLALVKALQGQVTQLSAQVKSLSLVNATDVPEDVLVAIAAAVSAYLGYRDPKKQPRFAPSPAWDKGTKIAQLNHTPVR